MATQGPVGPTGPPGVNLGGGSNTPTAAKTGANSYFNVLGKDPLAVALEDFINKFGKRYYGYNIVGAGAGKFTIKEREDQMLALGEKYGATFYGAAGLGGFLRAWDTKLGGKKATTWSASATASEFKTLMEAAQSSPSKVKGKTYSNLTDYLWDSAPPPIVAAYTGPNGPGGTESTDAWATAMLKAMGIKKPGENAIQNIQRIIGAESAGNDFANGSKGNWLRDNNPLNYWTWASPHTADTSAIVAKYHGTTKKEFGIYVTSFPTMQDGILASAAFIATQTQPDANGISMVQALQTNADASVFGGSLATSAWRSAGYASAIAFPSVTPYGGVTKPGSGGIGNTSLSIPGIIAATVAATTQAVIKANNAAFLRGATQTKDYSSYETVHNELYRWGLQDLSRYAWERSQKGEDAIQITLDIRNTPQYAARFPGLVQREKSGLPPITEDQYIVYQNEMMSYANTIALPKGFITPKEIGTLIANDVSPVEFNQRLQAMQAVALKADPSVRAEFAKYFGVRGGLGALTAYFADPHRATGILQEQVNQAMIGAEAINSGFGQLSKAHALQLAQDEASGKIALGTSRADLDKAASQLYLTAGAPGSVAPKVNRAELLGSYVPGYAGTNQRAAQGAVRNAENARESFLSAGGGFAATARGVRGAGGASTEGTPNT